MVEATTSIIHTDPDILGGVAVFLGTRVPVHYLFEYLAAGQTLQEFLDHFPTVSVEKAAHALEHANIFPTFPPPCKLDCKHLTIEAEK
jgi:uncharacterized protein (DUF433 family)